MATIEDGVYERKDREGYFVQWVGPDGKRKTAKADSKYLDAARKERYLYQTGQHPKQKARLTTAFADVARKFLDYQKPRMKTAKSYEREAGIVAHLEAFFTGTLAEITSAQVSDYVTARLAKVSKSTVRKEFILLKHLFRLAYDEWEFLPETHPNPCRKVRTPKFKDERTQHLTPDQFRRLLIAAPEPMRPIFALLTATGMRRSELLLCKWKYVDGSRIVLPPEVVKNDDPKIIHLNAFAQRVVASLPLGDPEELLFPLDVTAEAVSMAFHRTCKLLGFVDIRLHDLRHTFGTWLRQQGTELDIIAAQLGHRDLRMTKRYAKVASSQVSEAVDGLDVTLSQVTGQILEPRATVALPEATQEDLLIAVNH